MLDELIGRTLADRYEIREKIGEGGMAVVFKAWQYQLDREVAIKVLMPYLAQKNPTFVKRFEREAKVAAQLDHYNILSVYDFGVEQDYSFIVMRYVEEQQNLRMLMSQKIDLMQIVNIITQIADALSYAHEQGIVHRDIKPSNIMLLADRVLLADFGIAKLTETASTQLTGTHAVIGTPAYMSPEQGYGRAIDHRTDIYSLGVILFQMLTNTIPHHADTPVAIAVQRGSQPPPSVYDLNPNLPPNIDAVVQKALAIEPQNRYNSANQLAADLKAAVMETDEKETVIVSPPPPAEQKPATTTPPASSKNPLPILAGVGGVIAILLLGGLFFRGRFFEMMVAAVAAAVVLRLMLVRRHPCP